MYRCLNDIFMYCSGEPEADSGEAIASGNLFVTANKCNLNPETCGKCVPLIAQINPNDLEKLGTGIKYTLKAPPQEAAPRGKKEKKPESTSQESLL